jgi:hypothetical protein
VGAKQDGLDVHAVRRGRAGWAALAVLEVADRRPGHPGVDRAHAAARSEARLVGLREKVPLSGGVEPRQCTSPTRPLPVGVRLGGKGRFPQQQVGIAVCPGQIGVCLPAYAQRGPVGDHLVEVSAGSIHPSERVVDLVNQPSRNRRLTVS